MAKKTTKKTAPAPAPETHTIVSIPVDAVRARDEHDALGHVRPLDPEVVEGLASTFREYRAWGTIPPIVVTEDPDGAYTLVAGRHRLEAARIVGIHAQTVVVDHHDAASVRIKENMIRSELSFQDLIESLISIGDDADAVLRTSGKSRSWISKVSTVVRAVKSGLIQIDSCEAGLDATYRLAKTKGLEGQDGETKARGGRPKKAPAPAPAPAPASSRDEHEDEDEDGHEGGRDHDGVPAPSPAPAPGTEPARPLYAIYDQDDLAHVIQRLRDEGVSDDCLRELGFID